MRRPLRVLTWHVHGSYLQYLSHARCHFLLPVKEGRPEGYGGVPASLRGRENLREVAAGEVRREEFDVVLFQSHKNYLVDQHEDLSDEQRRLPRIFLEHDPPRESPTDTRHPVDDPEVLLVHVTHFNDLMWDPGSTPTRVIEHGVPQPAGVEWSGELERGLTVVNGLAARGRRLGADIFRTAREQVPLDLVGMASEVLGGLGEIPHRELPAFASRYRFLFNPIRYTSLGLAVCEAMAVGLPVIGLATTEMATAVENGRNGYVDTDLGVLVARMRELLEDPDAARRLSAGARETAAERFGLERFSREWEATFSEVAGRDRRAALGAA